MSTLGELRAALRVLLNDGDAVSGYLWSDAQLNRYLQDAVRAYGRHFLREMSTTVTVVVGQAAYALPDGVVRVLRVELIAEGDSEGEVLVEGGDAFGWGYQAYGGSLVLTETPTAALGTLSIRYLAAHEELSADDAASSVPAQDEDMLLAHAAGKAVLLLRVNDAKRAEFELRGGQSAREAMTEFGSLWEASLRVKSLRLRSGSLVVR